MSVNASSHLHKILIGADQQDWSKTLVSLDLKRNKRDRSGLDLIDGTLVLTACKDAPESINCRANPARWHRGQIISVQVTNRSGAFVLHPLGLLYIVKEPLPPADPFKPEITLQVGCVLNLRSFAQPDSDQSGIKIGRGADRTSIINTLLSATKVRPYDPRIPRIPPYLLGFPNGYPEFLISTAPAIALSGAVPEYPIPYPLPKQEGSFVEQAGKIAFGAGYVLRQNNLGQILPIKENLNPDAPLITLTIGRDEIDYSPIEGSETPSEIVKCYGTFQGLTPNDGTVSSSELDYGARVINTVMFRNIPVRQIDTTDTWELLFFASHDLQEIIQEPAGSLKAVKSLGGLELIVSTFTDEHYSYDQNRRLTSHTKIVWRPRGVVLDAYHEFVKERLGDKATFYSLTQLIYSEKTVTTYTYDVKERVKKIEIVTRRTAAAILPELGQFATKGAENLVISATSTQSWSETRPDEWSHDEFTQKTLAETNPELKELDIYQPNDTNTAPPSSSTPPTDPNQPSTGSNDQPSTDSAGQPSTDSADQPSTYNGNTKNTRDIAELLELGSTTSKHETSRAGQSQPPATEYAPALYGQTEKQIAGYAIFALAAGADEQQRIRAIEIEYAVSVAQLSALAQTEGKLLIGRRRGQQIQLPLLDEFLQDLHFPAIDCVEPDGKTYCFLADNISYSHDPEKACVGFDGIWIGTLV